MKHLLALACLCWACSHLSPQEAKRESLLSTELELWTDGEMLFAWGLAEGRKARVLFSSTALGNTLTENCLQHSAQHMGSVLTADGKEHEVVRLTRWSLAGKTWGDIEVALLKPKKALAPLPSKTWRLHDGLVLEEDEPPCILVLSVQQMPEVHMEFERGRLRFGPVDFVAQGKRIPFAEHPHWGIPFIQTMVLLHEKKIPLRLVLETSQWPSHVRKTAAPRQDMPQKQLAWEKLWLSPETALPPGNFEIKNSTPHWPWAEGSLGMKAFECCKLLWSPRQGTATLQWLPEKPLEATPNDTTSDRNL
ncbi:MAG: hypothetical protein FWG75_09340 [Cystobacterineae bacterium]|nr:hypothetical protein [Cystobacterineae bacterium]